MHLSAMLSDRMRWSRPLHDGIFDHEMHSGAVVSDKLMLFGGLTFNKGLLDQLLVVNTVTIRPAAAKYATAIDFDAC